jgi:hypothetical protein
LAPDSSGALLFVGIFGGVLGKMVFRGGVLVDRMWWIAWQSLHRNCVLRRGGNFAIFENISVEKKTASREAVFEIWNVGDGPCRG